MRRQLHRNPVSRRIRVSEPNGGARLRLAKGRRLGLRRSDRFRIWYTDTDGWKAYFCDEVSLIRIGALTGFDGWNFSAPGAF